MPEIVYVDDDPSGFMSLVRGEQQGRILAFEFGDHFPAEEALSAAKGAGVWLFDFFLVAQSSSSTNDENGLSFFQKWKKEVGGARPTTVLLSSQLENAIGEPPGKIERRHTIAQRHGVEWVGSKDEETLREVIELADAVAIIGRTLKPIASKTSNSATYDLAQLCHDVLGVPPKAEWANSAQRQVDRARPPREVPAATTAASARSLVSWLISHVLPYPSFLLTDAQAALRLQITPASFRALAEAVAADQNPSAHGKSLLVCGYDGPLASFLGRRWWRAGIDDLAWQLSQESDGFGPALGRIATSIDLERLVQPEPVLLSDADLAETDEVADASECVRVTDEDFPAAVDPAWVLIASAREDRELAAKVVFEDHPVLSPDQ